jgi:hypothetical protein
MAREQRLSNGLTTLSREQRALLIIRNKGFRVSRCDYSRMADKRGLTLLYTSLRCRLPMRNLDRSCCE